MKKVIVLSALIVVGCNYQVAKQDGLPKPFSNPEATTSFQLVYERVFQPKCAECHDFSNYAVVKAKARVIRDYVDSGFMPKAGALNGPLNPVEKALVLAWIDQGAPEFAGTPIGTPNPSPTPAPTPGPCEPDDSHHHDDHPHCETDSIYPMSQKEADL